MQGVFSCVSVHASTLQLVLRLMLEVNDASFLSNFPSHFDMALLKVFFVMVGLLSATFNIAIIFFIIALPELGLDG